MWSRSSSRDGDIEEVVVFEEELVDKGAIASARDG